MALTAGRMIDTLLDLELLDLDHPGVWPGELEGYEVQDIDWRAVQDPDPSLDDAQSDHRRWREVEYELDRRAKGGFAPPPGEVLDVLAWYAPIHYFGPAWGIYIDESAILDFAARIRARLDPVRHGHPDAVQRSVQAALTVLYLHEAFHHKVECFATRLEVIEKQRRYLPYQETVYRPLRGTSEHLEEGLACAEMIRRLKEEDTYKKGMPEDVLTATLDELSDWIPKLPPGYDRGCDLSEPSAFGKARSLLSSQVHEAAIHPSRNDDDWLLVPRSYQGFFTWKTIAHVIVPVGTTPIVPWFASPIPGLSISSRKLERLVRSQGYSLVPGGKGSHLKYRATGRPMIVIPSNRESVTARVLKTTAESLGLKSVRQLVGLL